MTRIQLIKQAHREYKMRAGGVKMVSEGDPKGCYGNVKTLVTDKKGCTFYLSHSINPSMVERPTASPIKQIFYLPLNSWGFFN